MTAEQRAEHCRRIGQSGGLRTYDLYGATHFRIIGTAGAQATIKKYGYAYWRGLSKAKRWNGKRQPNFDADMANAEAFMHESDGRDWIVYLATNEMV